MSYDDLLGGFADGHTLFTDHSLGERSARIVVQATVAHGEQEVMTNFVVDTGAAWNILDPELAQVLGIESTEERHKLVVRGQTWQGFLVKLPITIRLVAGDPFTATGTFWIPLDPDGEWSNPCFIGYAGLLQHIRFAVDPVDGRNRFFVAVPGSALA